MISVLRGLFIVEQSMTPLPPPPKPEVSRFKKERTWSLGCSRKSQNEKKYILKVREPEYKKARSGD